MIGLRILKNQNGITLLELVIAAGIMGTLSLGLMRMMEMQSKSARKMETDLNRFQLSNLLMQTMNDREACRNTFLTGGPRTLQGSAGATVLGGPPINEIRNRENDVILSVGDRWALSSPTEISIDQFGVRNFDPVVVAVPVPGEEYGFAELTVLTSPVQPNVNAAARNRITSVRVGIVRQDAAPFNILGCYFVSDILNQACSNLFNGNFDNIGNQGCRDIIVNNANSGNPTVTINSVGVLPALTANGRVNITAGGLAVTGGATTLGSTRVNGRLNVPAGNNICSSTGSSNCITNFNAGLALRNCVLVRFGSTSGGAAWVDGADGASPGNRGGMQCPGDRVLTGVTLTENSVGNVITGNCCRVRLDQRP